MEQVQIEGLVNELELRVDRLRALYDQYFMGIEKLEPTVARKDVERRFDVLRKEQIRNTALRFKFQTVLQRYNTYQTFWMRICRQIDEGTYKRHVMRANARFGDDAAKKKAEPEVAKTEAASHSALDGVGDDPFAFDDDEAKSGSIDVSFDLGDIDELGDLDDPFAAHPFPKLPSSRGATAKGDAELSALPPANLGTGSARNAGNAAKPGAPTILGAAAIPGAAPGTGAQPGATKMRVAPMPSLAPGAVVGGGKPRDDRGPDAHSRETERRLPAAPPSSPQAAGPAHGTGGPPGRLAAKSEPFFSLGKPAGAPAGTNATPGVPGAPPAMRVAPPRPPMPSSSGGNATGSPENAGSPAAAGAGAARPSLPSASGAVPPGGSGAVRPPLPSTSGVSRPPPPLAPRASMPSSAGATSSPAITAAAPVRAPMASSSGAASGGPGPVRPSMPSSPTAQVAVPVVPATSKGAPPVRAPLPSAPGPSASSPSIASLPPMRPPQTTSPGVAPPPRQAIVDAPPAQQQPRPTPAARPQPTAAAPAPIAARAQPVAATPATAHQPAAPAAAPPPAARPATRPAADAGDSEDRTRQLYSQYVETRRKQNEPTNAITYESLATTLKESTQRLKEKHGAHKAVDFEVVVKDGKTILRPIVK